MFAVLCKRRTAAFSSGFLGGAGPGKTQAPTVDSGIVDPIPGSRDRPITVTVRAARFGPTVKWTSLALIVLAVFVAARALDRGVAALKTWVDQRGTFGPALFG